MKFVQRIEDTNLWRKQFEDSGKGDGNIEGNYYVVNQTGKGETTGIIPTVAQDIIMAKSKIKRRKKVKKTGTKKRRKHVIKRKVRKYTYKRLKNRKKRKPSKKRKIRKHKNR